MNQSVNLRNAFLRLAQLPALGGKLLFLVLRVAIHLLAGKLLLKGLHIQENTLHTLQNDLLHHFLTDIVGRTDLGVLAIGGTEEVRLLPFVVVGDTVIQLLSAISAVQQTRKGTDNAAFRGPAAVLAKLLH